MFRCQILGAAWIGCLSSALMAAPPEEVKPGSSDLPSPNQSLSIEDDSAKPADPIGHAVSGKKDFNEAGRPEAVAVTSRAPIFLGKKRAAPDSVGASLMESAADAPWYRTSFGALAVVLGLMAILYFGLKRWAPSIKLQDGGLVSVLGRTVLGPRQSLVVIRIGQRVVLAGVSPERIDRLSEITDPDEVAALGLQASAGKPRGEFSAWLDREAAEFVDSDKAGAGHIARDEKRSAGSKPLTALLQKLRTTKV